MPNPILRPSSYFPGLALAGSLMLASCVSDRNAMGSGPGAESPGNPSEAAGAEFDEAGLRARGLLADADWKPVYLGPEDATVLPPGLSKAAATDPVALTFQESASLDQIPDANRTFVFSPGYSQGFAQLTLGKVWLSRGPGTSLIPPNEENQYYRILWTNACVRADSSFGLRLLGSCIPPPDYLNRFHQSRYGTDFLTIYAVRLGAIRVNFNVTGILVRGSTPVRMWYKDALGAWKVLSVGPGRWAMSMNDIKELQIRAASGEKYDTYSVDDIELSLP